MKDEIFPGYKLVRFLGKGGFGEAQLVYNEKEKKHAVIKTINLQELDEVSRQESYKEALILKNLDHPNITKFYDMKEDKDKFLYILMEYADGGDLKKKIDEHKQNNTKFKENEILDLLSQICLALKYIHHKHIMHRDIKSNNIFLTKNGVIKVGDFGISKVVNNTCAQANSQIGTPFYISPQMIKGDSYTNKTDIWSLGVLLYEMTELKYPFEGNILQIALLISMGIYEPIRDEYPLVKKLVEKMIAVEEKDRYSIDDILNLDFIQDRIIKITESDIAVNSPSYLQIKPGINIMGICKNNCELKDKKVNCIINSDINLIKETDRFICPKCKGLINMEKVYLYKCQFTIKIKQVNNNTEQIGYCTYYGYLLNNNKVYVLEEDPRFSWVDLKILLN